MTTALDNLLRLRSPGGTVYLHLVEWQGYRDPVLLWRVLGYLSWLGQRHPELVIVVTILYLRRGDDVGDTLRQVLDGREVMSIPSRWCDCGSRTPWRRWPAGCRAWRSSAH